MKKVLIFAFWVFLLPFIVLLKNEKKMTQKQWAYFDEVKLPQSTAALTMVCVILVCTLAAEIIVRAMIS